MKITIEKATLIQIQRAADREARKALPVRRAATFLNRKREADRKACRGGVK